MTIIRRNLLQFCICIVCVAGGLMVVSFSKSIANCFIFFAKITVLRSHTSHHDWLGVYCSLSKLWVPIIFHTGSLELCYQDILDILELWRWAGWRSVLPYLFIISAMYSVCGQVYITINCCIELYIDSDDVCINWYNSLFKRLVIIYCILFRCECEIMILFLFLFFCSFFSFVFFYLFFLTLMVRFSGIRLRGIWYSGRINVDFRASKDRIVT